MVAANSDSLCRWTKREGSKLWELGDGMDKNKNQQTHLVCLLLTILVEGIMAVGSFPLGMRVTSSGNNVGGNLIVVV